MVRISKYDTGKSRERAFTLIELLVVIAIIALLAAIIFPVFFTVRENARASNAMSNMHDISTKMEQYRLDHHAYPPVLFGYAVPGSSGWVPMNQALAAAGSNASIYFPGLYPAYISSIQEFQDPNNNAALDQVATISGIPFLCTGGSGDDSACTNASKGVLVARAAAGVSIPQTNFYKADAFDTSPEVTGTNKVDPNTYVLRYTTSYSGITSDGNSPGQSPTVTGLSWATTDNTCKDLSGSAQQTCLNGEANSLYMRQLRWQFPPSDTYVTCSTWHVPQSNKVLFLTADGIAKKMDVSDFLAGGPDGPLTVIAAGNVGAVSSPIWRLHP